MSKESYQKIKHCVHCGANIEENETYCPECGKLVIKVKSSKKTVKSIYPQKLEISRKCSGCGSIITSIVLDQCPICNTPLERIPEIKKASIQEKPGLIFTNKKLEPEHKFLLKKDSWNLKEGINVFSTCIYILIIVFFLLLTLITLQFDTEDLDLNIVTIVLSQLPELVFGIYPLWYIYNKRHSYKKLGFYSDKKKILITILVGIIGTFTLIIIDFLSNSFIGIINDAGLDFFDIETSIIDQNQVIRDADILWKIVLTLSLVTGVVSSEIVFRGVLHNALKQKFKNEYYVILIVALAYSVAMLLFTFPAGLTFFLTNFFTFTVLGVLYSINGNIYNTIIANCLYTIVIMMLIVL